MRIRLRGSRLLLLALSTLPAGCMCGPGYGSLGDLGTDTGAGTDNGTGDDGDDGGGTSDGGGSTGSSGGGGTGTSGSATASGTQGTGTTNPDCEPVPLADIVAGIGGFAMDGEAEEDRLGMSVSGAGDVNGDGLADIVMSAPYADPNGLDRSGRAYVIFGKTGTDGVSLSDVAQGIGGFVLDGEAQGDGLGGSVSGAGDVNGDGLADVVVGADGAGPNGFFSGRSYVVFGKTDIAPVSLADVAAGTGGFAVDGESEDDFSGERVSGAGDVNGDGLADVILGVRSAGPNGSRSGRSYVVFGKASTELVQLADVAQGIGGFALDGEAEDDESGYWVTGAGDVNGDGHADVIVGADSADPNGLSEAGRTYVVFGKASTELVQLADVAAGIGGFALDGEAADDFAGGALSGTGDSNGDGLADIVVGARTAGPNGSCSGRSYMVFGKTDTEKIVLADVAAGTGGFAMDGENADDWSGIAVSGVGDLNGDGRADVAVGTRSGPSSSRRVYVVFAKEDGDLVQLADVAQGIGGFALDGQPGSSQGSFSVGGAGDFNGDGTPDLVVGSSWIDSDGKISAGRAYVVFGFACDGGGG